jgi:Polysaccharide lyase
LSARRLLLLVSLGLAMGCAPHLDLGSEVIWSATHEGGDLSEWSIGAGGGDSADAPDATVGITTDYAHSGKYAVKLTNGAVGTARSSRVWRVGAFPDEAYYSAWYYLPRAYQTKVDWTILQFRSPTADPTMLGLFLDLDVRSLPGGELILSLMDHRAPYLRSATPDPPLLIPVGRWFHVESFFRNANDDTGHLIVWLDGQVNYDVTRAMGAHPTLYWTPCNMGNDLTPTQSEIYVDDAAISLVRVTPAGTL